MQRDRRHETPEQAWQRARDRAGLPPVVLSPLITKRNPSRAWVYACLLDGQPGKWWTVDGIATATINDEHRPTPDSVQSTLYLLLNHAVLERVRFQSAMTLVLTAPGAALLRAVLWAWAAAPIIAHDE